jgi:hypothetical protein
MWNTSPPMGIAEMEPAVVMTELRYQGWMRSHCSAWSLRIVFSRLTRRPLLVISGSMIGSACVTKTHACMHVTRSGLMGERWWLRAGAAHEPGGVHPHTTHPARCYPSPSPHLPPMDCLCPCTVAHACTVALTHGLCKVLPCMAATRAPLSPCALNSPMNQPSTGLSALSPRM